MIIGDQDRFAIQVELHNPSAGVWMNGCSSFWIAGQRVGNFECVDSLRDLLFCCEKMSCDQDRSDQVLFLLDTQTLIETLYRGLYNVVGDDDEGFHGRATAGTWARFNINPGTQPFVRWCIFLIEGVSAARCLWAQFDESLCDGQETQLEIGEFNRILNGVIDYLMEQYELASPH